MKVLWICGLPDQIRRVALQSEKKPCAAWSWILGHLPPPDGVELHIVCPVYNLAPKYVAFDCMGVHWHCFRMMHGEQYLFFLPVMLKIRSFAKRLNPDIIDGWGGETECGWVSTWLFKRGVVNVQGLLLLYAHMMGGGKRICGRHKIARLIRGLIERITYKRAKILCVESKLSHNALKEFYGHDSTIIYHPLREEFLKSNSVHSQAHPPTFLFIGEFAARKGAVDTLLAFSNIKTKNVRLIMIGSRGLPNCEMKHVLDKHSCARRVSFMGGLSAEGIVKIMGECDFFILPSYGDTGPTALKEALSQGLYPICYDNTGPKELIGRYNFGCLCKTGQWRELVSAMDEACMKREELIEKGKKVAGRVILDLSPATIWEQRLELYNSLV